MSEALMAMAAAAPAEHAETHERVARAMAAEAPQVAQGSIMGLVNRALGAGIPWGKILAAITIAAMGGFTPASIAAAIASLFGSTPAPAPAS